MTTYRYPGPKPFNTAQKSLFFGRNEEIDALYERICSQSILVLHGKSGVGKSSLLNAGLIPKIENRGAYFPIPISFNSFASNNESTKTPLQVTQDAIMSFQEKESSFIISNNINTSKDKHVAHPEESLLNILEKKQNFNNKQVILIFDQFEELFTYPKPALLAFKKQLTEISQQPFSVQVLLALRSDKVHLLDKIADALPEVLHSAFTLNPLDQEQVEAAILHPACIEGEFASPCFKYDDDALELIFKLLTKNGEAPIQNINLQMLCQTIELIVVERFIRTLTTIDLRYIEKAYENYYDHQLQIIRDPVKQLTVHHFIEEGLITPDKKSRILLSEAKILEQYNISKELLQKLVKTNIIDWELDQNNNCVYKLSHENLVAPILKAKQRRLAKKQKQVEEVILEAKREEKKKRTGNLWEFRQRQALVFGALGIAMTAVTIFPSLRHPSSLFENTIAGSQTAIDSLEVSSKFVNLVKETTTTAAHLNHKKNQKTKARSPKKQEQLDFATNPLTIPPPLDLGIGNYSISKKTSMRIEPTSKSKTLKRLEAGTEVILLEKSNHYWWKVKYQDRVGFVKALLLDEE